MREKDSLQISLSILLKLAALAYALLLTPLPNFGFCPQPEPTVACEFLSSNAVFVGTVISARSVIPRGATELDGWLYKLTVQELFRGPRTRTIVVFTEDSSGRFTLEVGKKYLLFADEFEGRLTIASCGNSAELSEAQDAIRELHRLKIPEDAVIEGHISFLSGPDPATGLPRIQIIIRADGRRYKTTSDREGWFHVHVPPGKYSAVVQQIPHWNITPFDLSYDNPNHFHARKGHCSGLQFNASSN
jgi:hypothetical protein